MQKRRIINIDREKCIGCKLCVNACNEGAIGMEDGKAVLLRDDYCDGLGNCLPVCPTGAISFIEKETLAFNKEEVEKNMAKKAEAKAPGAGCPGSAPKAFTGGCPGSMARALGSKTGAPKAQAVQNPHNLAQAAAQSDLGQSMLNQWPVQLKLVPVNAPYFSGAKLLIAADCSAFSCGDFHNRFMKGKVTVIGCPKLDEGDYSQKLTQILQHNDIKSVTVVRMEVPCCGGLARAAVTALQDCGKMIPWNIVTLSIEGDVLED